MILSSLLSTHRQNLPAAVAMMMLSVATYASQDVIVKLLPPEITVVQICFFRSLFAFIPIFFFSQFEPQAKAFKTIHWRLHFWRSVFSCVALLCFITSFRMIPLAEAYTLTFSCPLFLTAFSIPLLRERVPYWRWIAVLTGFMGVLVMLRPGSDMVDVGGLFALAGGFSYAISLIFVRSLSHHHQDSNTLIVSTFTVISILLFLPFLPFYWTPFDLDVWVHFVLIGTLGGTAQYAMTQAFRMAPVSQIAPFDYASLIWATMFGYFIFDEIPDQFMLIGAVLIVGSGIVIVRSERKTAAYDAG